MKRAGIVTAVLLSLFLVVSSAYAVGPSMANTDAGVINVNTASEEQLRMLPLIDDQLAKNIIDYRNSNGPFRSLDDLKNVSGMSKARFDQIRPYLVLSGDTTFNPSMYKQQKSSSPMTNPSY